jgi:hypothetical protein
VVVAAPALPEGLPVDAFAPANLFFGASEAAGRFRFFWEPGMVKKDDIVAHLANSGCPASKSVPPFVCNFRLNPMSLQ